MAQATWLLRNCNDFDDTLIVYGDYWADYADGRILSLAEYVGKCWTVIEETPGEYENVSFFSCYNSCEECNRKTFALTECTGRIENPIYSLQEDLEQYVGQIIKIPYYENGCFTVSQVQYLKDRTYYEVDYSNVYDTCWDCRQQKTVLPNVNLENCDLDYLLKVKEEYSELAYKEVMSKRYGVEFCCPFQNAKWEIKNELLEFELANHKSPELPEPEVVPCCIVQDTSACTSTCAECSEPTTNECDCVCDAAGTESTHDCFTYTFDVIQGLIGDATGNDNTKSNNKVYFGYIPCGGTKSITKAYTSPIEDESFCVLGIAILGYYKNNEWVDASVNLTRGTVICTENINDCNTCN